LLSRDNFLILHDRGLSVANASSELNIVRAGGLIGFDRLIRDLGEDPEESLRPYGLKVEDLADPDKFVSYSRAVEAMEGIALKTAVRDFGLRLSAIQDLEFYGLLWLIMQSAPTVREGMLLGIKYVNFHAPAQGYRSFRSPDGKMDCVEMFQRLPGLPDLPQTAEHAVGHLYRIVVELSDNKLRPSEIHFRHAPVGSEAQYRRHFGLTPHFGSDFDGIAVEPMAFRRPISSHNPLLGQFVERFIAGVTPDQRQSTANQVSGLLNNLVRANMAELGTVASVMGQHPRTLQRRLKAEGVEYDTLRDGARKAWARELLAQNELGLAHIAHLLGFSDQSVLTRACQRWFGATPKRLRQNPDMMDAKAAD
jgi:AraC-like DNA-binding protein